MVQSASPTSPRNRRGYILTSGSDCLTNGAHLTQYLQPSTTSHLSIDASDLQSRSSGLSHSQRQQSAFPDVGRRRVEHGEIAGDAAHCQMRRKGHGPVLLGKPVDQLL